MNACDSFSWKRVGMLFRLYSPILVKQFWIYVLAIALMYLIWCGLISIGIKNGAIMALPASITSYMFYFAPVVLARRDFRCVSNTLPVTVGEKIAFFTLYFWGVLGIVCLGLGCLGNWVMLSMFPNALQYLEEAIKLFGGVTDIMVCIVLMNVVGSLMGSAMSLYGMLNSKGNRLLGGILYPLVAMFASGLLAGIYAFVYMMAHLKQIGEMAAHVDPDTLIIPLVRGMFLQLFVVMGILYLIVLVVALILVYKKLRRGGF